MSRLDPEQPILPVLAKGYIGRVPWAICTHGDNLRIAIGEQEIDIGSRKERAQLLDLAEAFSAAYKELLP